MEEAAEPKMIREKTDELKGTHRLMAISAVDEGDSITLCYHFWRFADSEVLNLKVKLGKEEIRTISDIIPNSLGYEREIHDLMGVEFEGAHLEPLLVPKGYEKYPLRKALKTAVQSAGTGSSDQQKK